MKRLSILRVAIILTILSSTSVSAASSCTKNEKSLDVLRSSWIDEDGVILRRFESYAHRHYSFDISNLGD